MTDRDWSAYAKSTYQYELGGKKMLRMTKSSLTSDFDYCPKQYEYKRIHRLPQPSTDAMIKGTNVHDAIEQFYINLSTEVNKAYALLQEDKRDKARELFNKCLPVPDEPYKLGEEEPLRVRLEWDLDRLAGSGPKYFLPIINELEIHAYAEEHIEINGEEFTVPVHYAGSIDRAFRTEEGGVAIMELKTGKWVQTLKNDEWIDSSFKVQSMRTEMAFYKDLLELADHEYQNVTHWGWVYPSGGATVTERYNKWGYEQRGVNHIQYEPCTGRREKDYAKKIRRMKDALLTAYLTGHFPESPSAAKCAWCAYKPICPSWDGSDKPEEYLKLLEENE